MNRRLARKRFLHFPDSTECILRLTPYIRDANGEIRKWIGTCTDIEEIKQAEERLRDSEQQFRTLADSIPNLAWWADGDGYINWYNQQWYEYTGTTPEQMEGWGWQSIHDPNELPRVLQRWKASIATGEPFNMELPLRGRDGQFRRFLTRVGETWLSSWTMVK
jgi:PAS domain S-box-containing protein